MARIDEYLQKILSARYGEEVRRAIHDSIDEINRVNEANISTVQTIADTAQGYADDAEDSKDLAAQSVTDAQAQVTLAQQQVTLATTQATNSANSAEDSEAWAVGQRGGIDVPSSDETYQNNSKYWQERANYWYQQAQAIAESFSGALRPMGTVTFENLPPLAQADSGDMYNISNQFTTTSDFVEGAGIVVPLGSNVYKTVGEKWDVLAGSPVTGVKGNSESSYRRGNVNITKGNIGLGNVDNTSDANKPISTAQQAALDLKQNITDNSLTTTSKTIPGAINEIKDSLDNKISKQTLRAFWYGCPAPDENATLQKQIHVPFPNGIQPSSATLLAARSPGHNDYSSGTTISINNNFILVTLPSAPINSNWLEIIVLCTYD